MLKELNQREMESINGGSLSYCATLHMIAWNNNLSDDAIAGWNLGWGAGECWNLHLNSCMQIGHKRMSKVKGRISE